MKIVIAGSRKYNDYNEAKEYVDSCIREFGGAKITILSGGCKGADMIGERYAAERGFELERIDASWSKYGKAAGPVRNKIMADMCDVVICFWDGISKGTASMIECTQKVGKPIFIKYVSISDND